MTTAFRPIEAGLEQKYLSETAKQRIRWYLLIRDAEDYRRITGMGLANIWGHIHAGRYVDARQQMDAHIQEWRDQRD